MNELHICNLVYKDLNRVSWQPHTPASNL